MIPTQIIYLITLPHGNPYDRLRTCFLPAEGVVFGHRLHRDRARFNPGTFIVYIIGGFNLEGVAFTRSANINGLGMNSQLKAEGSESYLYHNSSCQLWVKDPKGFQCQCIREFRKNNDPNNHCFVKQNRTNLIFEMDTL